MVKNLLLWVSVLFTLWVWLFLPLASYSKGTSEDITVAVIAEPFGDGDQMVYLWTGTIVRSCAISVRRSVVDSLGIVTQLKTLTFPAPPRDVLGQVTQYEARANMPLLIPNGPATYHAIEVPECSWMQRLFPIGVPYPPVHFTVTRN